MSAGAELGIQVEHVDGDGNRHTNIEREIGQAVGTVQVWDEIKALLPAYAVE